MLEDRKHIVEDENAGPDHPWAGVYSSFHVDAGTEIAIAPVAGYVVTTWSMGRRRIRACGRVRFVDELVTLEPEFSDSDNWHSVLTLIHVVWGDRHYLLYESRLASFCNRVNAGDEASRASEGLLTLSRDAKVYGRPKLPAPFERYLFDEPLIARVVSKHGERTVDLDIGRDRGAFEKMWLYRNPYDGKLAIVESVGEATCEASCAGGQYFADLPIGAQFTTRRTKP
jgi:hypothetical protein